MDYDEFFRRTGPRLLRVCYLATLDREAAADATQEALTRAWHHWDKINTGNPEAWARVVVLNLCRSRWRRLAREARFTARTATVTELHHPLPDIDLQRALATLSPRQRQAVALYYLEDLSIADCASAMGSSEGAVKSYLSRAREQLAKHVNVEEELV